jgi:hypothetical protein
MYRRSATAQSGDCSLFVAAGGSRNGNPSHREGRDRTATSLRATLARHPNGTDRLLGLLGCIQPQPAPRFSHLADTFAGPVANRSSSVCVLLLLEQQRHTIVRQRRRAVLPVTVVATGAHGTGAAEEASVNLFDPKDQRRDLARI